MDHTITLLTDSWRGKEEFLQQLSLPLFYMGDFSLMAIVVDDYSTACRTLRQAGYKVLDKSGAADIFFDRSQQLPLILAVLESAAVKAEFRDIAETLYQA